MCQLSAVAKRPLSLGVFYYTAAALELSECIILSVSRLHLHSAMFTNISLFCRVATTGWKSSLSLSVL